MSEFDRLAQMFHHQREMQISHFGADPQELQGEDRKRFVTAMAYSVVNEIVEATNEIAWKPWAATDKLHRDAYIEEIIDAWHFMINMLLVANVSPEEFHMAYFMKAQVNKERQESGYTGNDKCPECGR